MEPAVVTCLNQDGAADWWSENFYCCKIPLPACQRKWPKLRWRLLTCVVKDYLHHQQFTNEMMIRHLSYFSDCLAHRAVPLVMLNHSGVLVAMHLARNRGIHGRPQQNLIFDAQAHAAQQVSQGPHPHSSHCS